MVQERISPDFTWGEMIHSRTADAYGIENRPGTAERVAIERLVRELLQPLRDLYGKPIRISSGYRCEKLNKLVGGVATSQHLKGEAADCVVSNTEEFIDILQGSGLVFDQVIWYRKRDFVHLSLKGSGNRGIINYKL